MGLVRGPHAGGRGGETRSLAAVCAVTGITGIVGRRDRRLVQPGSTAASLAPASAISRAGERRSRSPIAPAVSVARASAAARRRQREGDHDARSGAGPGRPWTARRLTPQAARPRTRRAQRLDARGRAASLFAPGGARRQARRHREPLGETRGTGLASEARIHPGTSRRDLIAGAGGAQVSAPKDAQLDGRDAGVESHLRPGGSGWACRLACSSDRGGSQGGHASGTQGGGSARAPTPPRVGVVSLQSG